MRPPRTDPAQNFAGSVALLAQLHDYSVAYPSLAQRLPAITAWVKSRSANAHLSHQAMTAAAPGAWGLSAAEARLAAFLVQGGTLTQYAQRHTLSRYTVRNQLTSIFAKLGVNRQADLVRLLIGA